METSIKNLVELAKEVSNYFAPIQSNGTSKDHTDRLSTYFNDFHATRSVRLGLYPDNVEIFFYNNRINFPFHFTSKQLDKIHTESMLEFEEYKVKKRASYQDEIKEAKQNQIKELQEKLNALTNEPI